MKLANPTSRRANAFTRIALAASLAIALAGSARSAEVVGRIVDNMQSRVFEGASVDLQAQAKPGYQGQTDGYGFFRISDVSPGPYVIEVSLRDGSSFTTRLLVVPDRTRQFVEFDYARVAPPDDDHEY